MFLVRKQHVLNISHLHYLPDTSRLITTSLHLILHQVDESHSMDSVPSREFHVKHLDIAIRKINTTAPEDLMFKKFEDLQPCTYRLYQCCSGVTSR